MLPLVPYFRDFNRDEAQALAEEAVRNNQIWSAAKCRTEYLPEFRMTSGTSRRSNRDAKPG